MIGGPSLQCLPRMLLSKASYTSRCALCSRGMKNFVFTYTFAQVTLIFVPFPLQQKNTLKRALCEEKEKVCFAQSWRLKVQDLVYPLVDLYGNPVTEPAVHGETGRQRRTQKCTTSLSSQLNPAPTNSGSHRNALTFSQRLTPH